MPWHFRGTPYYLAAQGRRLGLAQVLTDRARTNPEIHRASTLLGQLCERYHRAPKVDGVPQIAAPELAQIQGTLGQVEIEVGKLHALAAAAQAMSDEAYAAFGLEAPNRRFVLHCDFDDPPEHRRPDLQPIRIQPGSERANNGKYAHSQ